MIYFSSSTRVFIRFIGPVAIIGDTPVVGYRPNKMKELLGV
jgi:hypothetical protein